MNSIPAQQAVRGARKSLLDLYEDDPPKELALEGIELVTEEARPLWSVTFGFHRPKSVSPVGSSAIPFFMPSGSTVEHRVYKTVFLDASTGEFVKMEIRQLQ